jgi:cytochrome c553
MKPTARLLSSLMFAACLAAPALASDAPAAAKPDLVKGEAIAAQVCASCHAVDAGRGAPANPILKAQHPEYLVKQLTEFKSGRRSNAIMKGMASTLSTEDMRNVAAFYASKPESLGASTSKATVALGEKIYRGGIADRQVPACAGCHGPLGSGIPAQYPRLRGQHASYTEAQLLAFRSGLRKNGPMMMTIVQKMNDAEIKAVSDYMAGMR